MSTTPVEPDPQGEVLPPAEPRRVTDGAGKEWEVCVAGRALSGTRPDRGAPLLLLHFIAVDPAGALRAGDPPPERTVPGRSLDDFPDAALVELLQDARPAPPRRAPSPQPRGGRGGGFRE